MIRSHNYHIIWVYTKEFPGREIPLVLLADGRPGYIINQWIVYLLDEQITPSRLEMYVRALCHLYDFVMVRYPQPLDPKQTEGLLADFINAKKFGTDSYCIATDERYHWLHSLGLYWKPLAKRTNTIALYLNAINKFDEWQVTFHNSAPLNPYDERLMTAWEIYRDFQQRVDWDPFIHLHATRQHTERDYQTSVQGKYSHSRFKTELFNRKAPKAFPVDCFIDLINESKNPRDRLLWLLMGAGSLRSSETLHLFLSDVAGVDPKDGDARVLLTDPEDGYVTWTDENNRQCHASRKEFFARNYKNSHFPLEHPLCNLQPRTLYGKRNSGLHSGFKGMTFGLTDGLKKMILSPDNRPYEEHSILWANKYFGQHFASIFEEYQREYLWKNRFTGRQNPKEWPWHPWLMICTNKLDYGMPLTMPALKQAWKRALKRIGMEDSGIGMHSLRHMYGYYCANILRLPIEMTQILMRHASVHSTQVYYTLESSVVRDIISKAATLEGRIENEWGRLGCCRRDDQ